MSGQRSLRTYLALVADIIRRRPGWVFPGPSRGRALFDGSELEMNVMMHVGGRYVEIWTAEQEGMLENGHGASYKVVFVVAALKVLPDGMVAVVNCRLTTPLNDPW